MTLCYYDLDQQSKNFYSQNDIVKCIMNQKEYTGKVVSSQGESIKVYLEELEITREFRRQFLKLESRYVDQVGRNNIPIQPNDLVSYTSSENQVISGIVTDVDEMKKLVKVYILQKGMQQIVTIPAQHLRFCAKNYLINIEVANQYIKRTNSRNHTQLQASYQSSDSNQLSQTQSLPGISFDPSEPIVDAILVDAPCVVKVVPYDTDPNDYDDFMRIESVDGDQDVPSVLPLIRMRCGTILVVRAPPESHYGQFLYNTTNSCYCFFHKGDDFDTKVAIFCDFTFFTCLKLKRSII